MNRLALVSLLLGVPLVLQGQGSVLVVTADASDYVLAAGGTLAGMASAGAKVTLLRVTNDDKDGWNLAPEVTASRTRQESEQAARLLGIGKVVHLGYRAGELGGVSQTELRDRILFYVRSVKPDVMFIPNPYAEYVEVVDRHYTGMAAEEARRIAPLRNHQPPHAFVGLEPHTVRELYYYAQPLDPRRREPEGPAQFVPQPVVKDIAATFTKKTQAAQALATVNQGMAMRLKERLESTGRRLPLLDQPNPAAIAKLVAINVKGLAEICAKDSPHKLAEEFHYAGPDYQLPASLRGKP